MSFRNRDPRLAIARTSVAEHVQPRFRLDDNGVGGRNLDARTMFYYGYTVNTPAMVAKIVGNGSQYALGFADSAELRSTGRRPRRRP